MFHLQGDSLLLYEAVRQLFVFVDTSSFHIGVFLSTKPDTLSDVVFIESWSSIIGVPLHEASQP